MNVPWKSSWVLSFCLVAFIFAIQGKQERHIEERVQKAEVQRMQLDAEDIPNVNKMPVTRCSRAKFEFPIKIMSIPETFERLDSLHNRGHKLREILREVV